jgi:hypothetical protein
MNGYTINIESLIQQFHSEITFSILDSQFLTNTYPGGNATETFTVLHQHNRHILDGIQYGVK